ncbi:bacteriohemerythrin [Azonexus sp. IMCC34839]|uniref:bacteriohemerythrin n=1 Tax=Azonexus sp. IMCC34839 TaxID=3133695 RepID=UPI003999BA33
MEKEQEILAVSRLAFELTRLGGVDGDLDRLLERLHALLSELPGISVRPACVLLLNNPRQHLVQVAQFGLPPAWGRHGPVGRLACLPNAIELAFLCTPEMHRPPLEIEGIAGSAPCFVLPLTDDGRQLGRLLLFIDPLWQPDAVEIEFMTDLSRTLSMLVARCLVNETLRVREVELEDARTDAIRRLGAASEYRDNETGMHVMRMTHYATAIAKAMGLPEEQRELLNICAPMHDVGKIGISDAILLKPGRLTGEEFEVMKTHTEIGRRLLDGSDALISAARDIASCHHERWDGSGYPNALAGEEIPILARICAIADVLDALTSVRPYKHPWPFNEAVAFIQRESGGHFDPAVVSAFERAMPEILRIRELYRDDIIDPRQAVSLPKTAYREGGWVSWMPEYSVGIDVIDEHHRYLFDLTNDLFDVVAQKRGAREVARILKALDQYAQVHFRAEERMMAHYSYARLDRQEHQHHRFEARLREFYSEMHDNPLTAQFEVLLYLRDWLVGHIRNEDAQLRELIADVA